MGPAPKNHAEPELRRFLRISECSHHPTTIATQRFLRARVRVLHRAISLLLPHGVAVWEAVVRTRLLPFFVGLTQGFITFFVFLRKSYSK